MTTELPTEEDQRVVRLSESIIEVINKEVVKTGKNVIDESLSALTVCMATIIARELNVYCDENMQKVLDFTSEVLRENIQETLNVQKQQVH